MKLSLIAAVLLFPAIFFQASAQAVFKCNENRFEDPFLENIIGNWTGSGTIGNEAVTYDFRASWELNHQFVLLSFADTAKQPQYIAHVYIGVDCISERYVVHWIDNFGGRFSETLGSGIRTGDSIPFRFEYPDGPFINTFTYEKDKDSWRLFSISKNSKGLWETFGDIRLKRMK